MTLRDTAWELAPTGQTSLKSPVSETLLGATRQAGAVVNESADATASTSTNYTLSVDDYFDGRISFGADEDWVRISLQSGQDYVFGVHGTGGPLTGLEDTILSIYNASGALLASNDDLAPAFANFFSALSFTASYSGVYYLGVESFDTATGDYRILAANAVFDLDQVASYMLDLDWGVAHPWVFDASTGDTLTVNLTALTTEGRTLALAALESWTIATGVSFQTTASGTADLIFGDNEDGAFAGPDGRDDFGYTTQATVNVGESWLDFYGTTLNSYSFSTYIHEIGHALGLGHTGPYDGSASYATDALFANDSYQVSVMSYFTPTDNTTVAGANFEPITPMPADYVAIQREYGTPVAYAGDTVWGANSNVGGYLGQAFEYMFDGRAADGTTWSATGDVPGFTIFDTSGIDTFNLSGMTARQVVNLGQNQPSSVAGGTNNVFIARGTVIENATGGSGNDVLTGNSAGNRLIGGQGSDLVVGLSGNDTAWAGAGDVGDDTIMGGAGNDITGTGAGDDVIIGDGHNGTRDYGSASNDGRDTVFSGTGDDLIVTGSYNNPNADAAYGSVTAAHVQGVQNDVAYAGDGRDIIFGAGGADTLGGGAGADYIHAGGGWDVIYAGPGADADTLIGGGGNDTIYNGAGNDQVFGSNGADDLWGGPGEDTLTGGGGADTFGFTLSNGLDTVTDFTRGQDKILIQGVSGFDALGIEQIGSDTQVSAGALVIVLQGVTASALTASDFDFL